jgi:acetolactate synthase-1/2/3 large subunit
MNGAQALIRTLRASGVDTCFANPGTSEMHFVAALDSEPDTRAILGLYEGSVTAAADGYGRIAGRPAATLLHLGPGLANGWANLHNARRAGTPLLNIVGDHATYHRPLDAPLTSDVDTLARTVSKWVGHPTGTAELGAQAATAAAAALAPPTGIATLILPADVSWSGGAEPAPPAPESGAAAVDEDTIRGAAATLRSGEPAVILLGGAALSEAGVRAAARIRRATGARVYAETFPARLRRGAGTPPVDRLAYLAEQVTEQLAGAAHLLLAGARAPVSFFGYPDAPSELTPPGATVHTLAGEEHDATACLGALADLLAPDVDPEATPAAASAEPSGELTAQAVCAAVGAVLPENAIISDEAVTSGVFLAGATAGASPHDVLTLTGGAIGQGLGVAAGAAVAAPQRPVVCLEADGSFMYGPAALWTMAREGLDVTTVVLSNRSYRILRAELSRVGAESGGRRSGELLDLARPQLDFCSLARGMGVPACRPGDAGELVTELRRAFAEPGPHLIEAVI